MVTDLHPAAHAPLVLCLPVAGDVLLAVGEILSKGVSVVKDDRWWMMDQVQQAFKMLGVGAFPGFNKVEIPVNEREKSIGFEDVEESSTDGVEMGNISTLGPETVIIKEPKYRDGIEVAGSVLPDFVFKAVKTEPIYDKEEYYENSYVEPKCKVVQAAELSLADPRKTGRAGRTDGPRLTNRKMPNRRHTSYFCPHCQHRFASIAEKLAHARKLSCYG